jgi:hypothetical protein
VPGPLTSTENAAWRDLVTRLVQERLTQRPDALGIGFDFPVKLARAAIAERGVVNFTPATHVVDGLLTPDNRSEFCAAIARRRDLERAGLGGLDQELQAFVDGLTLFACAAVATFTWVLPEPRFWNLPEKQLAAASAFQSQNREWSQKTITAQDVQDGASFMNRLVERVDHASSNSTYRRGVRTARDTLLLYTSVIIYIFERLRAQHAI